MGFSKRYDNIEGEYIHLQECIKSLNNAWVIACEIEKESKNIKSHAIVFAAYEMIFIEYCKPFKKSNGKNSKRYFLPVPPELNDFEKELHENIIRLRDKVIAHSDIDIKEPSLILDSANILIASNIEDNWPQTTKIRQLLEKILDILNLKANELAQETVFYIRDKQEDA